MKFDKMIDKSLEKDIGYLLFEKKRLKVAEIGYESLYVGCSSTVEDGRDKEWYPRGWSLKLVVYKSIP